MSSARDVSESYWEAECRRDLDAIVAHYLPDATFEDSGGVRKGHAELRETYEGFARDFPLLEVEIVHEYIGGTDTSGFEYDALLTDSSGKRFRIRGVNIVVVRDGKFASVRSYEDAPSPV